MWVSAPASFTMSWKSNFHHLTNSNWEEVFGWGVNLMVTGPTPPSLIFLKTSHFYLHSGFIQPVSFLLTFCKGCEPHPKCFRAFLVPCDYTLWGRQKTQIILQFETYMCTFIFLFCFCCNSEEQTTQIWNIEQSPSRSSRKVQNSCNKILFFGILSSSVVLILIFSMDIFTAVSGIITTWKSFISQKMLNASIFRKY